jgi:hypothetical protein
MSRSTAQLLEQSHRIGVQFLLTDLAAAATFLDVADVTGQEDTRTRNREKARYVYETVLRLMPKVVPSDEERTALEQGLAELKLRLIATGHWFDPDGRATDA